MTKPIVVAEIGCNHKGDMETANKMVKSLGVMGAISPASKIDVVKFQKRTNGELLSPEEYYAPHPDTHNSPQACRIPRLLGDR